MKKSLLILAGLLLFQIGQTQEKSDPKSQRSHLAFSAGPAFPIGAFGETSTTDAGLAKIGYTLNIEYVYNFKSWGLIGHGFYGLHNTKPVDPYYSPMSVKTTSWNYSGFTAGAVWSTPDRGGKWIFDLRTLLGVAFVNSPEMTFGYDGSEAYKMESEKATTLALELGGGARYLLTNSVFLNGGLNMLRMTPEFETYGQSIYTLNLNVGIGFRF